LATRILSALGSFLGSDLGAFRASFWRPAVDIYQSKSGWLVKLDLAGVRPADLEIRARGCRLVVQGLRRDWVVAEGARARSMEIAYDRFERIVDLPCVIEIDRAATEYRDGMLLIRVKPAPGKE
jgi:HSP20 family protein